MVVDILLLLLSGLLLVEDIGCVDGLRGTGPFGLGESCGIENAVSGLLPEIGIGGTCLGIGVGVGDVVIAVDCEIVWGSVREGDIPRGEVGPVSVESLFVL